MPVIVVETFVRAPAQLCFDMARDIDVHTQTVARFSAERAVAGVTSGRIELGQSVTFEAVHFGVRQRLTSKVVEFDSPVRFVDEMQEGAFKRMRHAHDFLPSDNGTLLRDTIDFAAPFGLLGKAVEPILKWYLRRFIIDHNQKLKRLIEAEHRRFGP